MDITSFFARFWGSLFMILGALSFGAKFLGKVIASTEDRAVTVSTGYITFLLGLVTVILHNVWVMDWRVGITVLGWATLAKGVMKIGFPERVRARALLFKSQQTLWGAVIFFLGAWLFLMGG